MGVRRPHILFVEDDPDQAHLVMQLLHKHHMAESINHVLDGEAALDYLLRRGDNGNPGDSPRPDLILLDLRLPKVDGLEVLNTIKTTDELLGIPVVILTSSDADKDIHAAYEAHANSYLLKSSDFADFGKMIAALGSYWLDCNQYSERPRA